MLESQTELSFEERLASCPFTIVIPPKIQFELKERGQVESGLALGAVAPRFRCRGPAVLEWVESPFPFSQKFPTTQVIVKNLSSSGFSILADRQWYPDQIARLYLPLGMVRTTVARVTRLGSRCFDIGLKVLRS